MNSRLSDLWNDSSAPQIAPEHFNQIVATAADLAIIVDLNGIVQSLIVNPLNPSLGRLDHWKKRNICEFLTEKSWGKVERQLEAYRSGEVENVHRIEVNHCDNANWEFPVRYTLHRTGDQDLILMLGHDMRPTAELQTRNRVIMEAAREPFVLVDASMETVDEDLASLLAALYRDGTVAMVITDRVGVIRYANEAFLSLCGASQLSDIKPTSLSDYLSRGSADLRALLDTATLTGRAATYSTKLQTSNGTRTAIEVSVTSLPDRAEPSFAFIIREASRMDLVRDVQSQMPVGIGEKSMQNVIARVGSAPLKDIVAATTDVIEKMCIETAVKLTGNNRVAAAEMLGLSRQSLYVKLRKFGLLSRDS